MKVSGSSLNDPCLFDLPRFKSQVSCVCCSVFSGFESKGLSFDDIAEEQPDDDDLPFIRCLFLIQSRKRILDKLMEQQPPQAAAAAPAEPKTSPDADDSKEEGDGKCVKNDRAKDRDPLQKMDELAKDVVNLLSQDEYLMENAGDARPLCVFDRPELLFSTCSSKDTLDKVMKQVTNALEGCKTVGKALKRSCYLDWVTLEWSEPVSRAKSECSCVELYIYISVVHILHINIT